jgi:ubiquinone/menaquinone biosynthesis C-methylase UbiE
MILSDKSTTPNLYADLYSNFKFIGAPCLAYRDMPDILNKYVSGKKVLDYGCGTAESTLFLKSLGYDVVAVDINERMLSIAQERDPNGKYTKINSGAVPFHENSFDLVLCSFVLLEIGTKDEMLNTVQEIHRVLKKGGKFISISASDHTYHHEWLTLNTDFPENKNITSGSKVKIEFLDINLTIDDYFWTEKDYREVFQKAGLVVTDVHNPLGTEDDGYKWKDETTISPISIIICNKE